MCHKHEKPKKSIFAALDALDWAWLILAAMLAVVFVCMIIGLGNKVNKPTNAESTEAVDGLTSDTAVEYVVYTPEPEVVAEIPPRTYIGTCRLTVYNSTESHHGYNTATGAKSQHLMTCAVDPKVIPYGSNVIIKCADGTEHRCKAVDCGNFSGEWVDIFFDGTIQHGIEWLEECFNNEHAEVWIEVSN